MATIVDKPSKQQPPKAAPPPAAPPTRPRVSPKVLYIAGGVLVLLALVAWGVTVSGKRKAEYSARALDDARAVAESGNLPAASTNQASSAPARSRASQRPCCPGGYERRS